MLSLRPICWLHKEKINWVTARSILELFQSKLLRHWKKFCSLYLCHRNLYRYYRNNQFKFPFNCPAIWTECSSHEYMVCYFCSIQKPLLKQKLNILMAYLGFTYTNSDSCLFIDSSITSLKVSLMYKSNMYPTLSIFYGKVKDWLYLPVDLERDLTLWLSFVSSIWIMTFVPPRRRVFFHNIQ